MADGQCSKRGNRFNDLTGRKFEKLTVISCCPCPTRSSGYKWTCICDCGKQSVVRAAALLNGSTRSCGCLCVGAAPTDLTGVVFGKLVAKKIVSRTKWRNVIWLCECECGHTAEVSAGNLRKGKTTSCGCKLTTHGMTQTAEFRVWSGMKARCNNPRNASYKDYGGRGIKVCERWMNSFQNFIDDMGARPSGSLTIERKDNSLGYEPGNCVWETKSVQSRNRRTTRFAMYGAEVRKLSDLADELNLEYGPLYKRASRNNWVVTDEMVMAMLSGAGDEGQ